MTQGVWGGQAKDIGPWAEELSVPSTLFGQKMSTPIPVEDYWQSLLWYNSELMKDDYVMGACLFVTGAAGKIEWDTFEHLGPVMDRLASFQKPIELDPSLKTPIPQSGPGTAPVQQIDRLLAYRPTRKTPPWRAAEDDQAAGEVQPAGDRPVIMRNARIRFELRDERRTYRVGEKVFVRMAIDNTDQSALTFGILGLLTNTGKFQTSWDSGLVQPGTTFQHIDGISFDTPGTYTIQLSICFAQKQSCFGSEAGWVRFEPVLPVTIQ
jgi:hypothetical protein